LTHAQFNPSRRLTHPVHIVLLVSTLPLFLGALLSDWAYSVSYQIQWINFAAWLIVGALLLLGAALVWTVVDSLRSDVAPGRGKWIFVGLVIATFVVGFINALVHAKDAWATMPAGLILSIIALILAVITVTYGFARPRVGEQK
jgi:uncharacterized membrane protein